MPEKPVPVAARCKDWIYGVRTGSTAALMLGLRVGSRQGMDECLICGLSVVCCQVEVSATGRSLVQMSPSTRIIEGRGLF
jgi:hypothetical protein